MIENTIKILKKLIDNVDKYKVNTHYYKHENNSKYTLEYNICWEIDKQFYHISIIDNKIIWDKNNGGSRLDSLIDEYYQFEILDLCQKLHKECENYTSTVFRNFADESDNESDDDLE